MHINSLLLTHDQLGVPYLVISCVAWVVKGKSDRAKEETTEQAFETHPLHVLKQGFRTDSWEVPGLSTKP